MSELAAVWLMATVIPINRHVILNCRKYWHAAIIVGAYLDHMLHANKCCCRMKHSAKKQDKLYYSQHDWRNKGGFGSMSELTAV